MTPLVLMWLSGCVTNTVRFPPDLWNGTWVDGGWADTGSQWTDRPQETGQPGPTPTGPATIAQITRVVGACDAGNDAVDFTAVTDAWSTQARLSIFRAADQRQETHPMELVDLDPGGGWDRWQIVLADGAEPAGWEPAVTTGFDCDEIEQLTWAIRLSAETEPGLSQVVDCVTWGADPAALEAELLAEDEPYVADLAGCRTVVP